jgi:signal transduction histidine kinase
VALADDLPDIETDRGKLQQILMNLVNNAFQAMGNKGHLAIAGSADNGNRVKLTVGDDGCGMDEECLAKIFEPFYTTKEKGKGTGLGLPITYGLVKKLKGTITVDSRENQGTTFVISLPVRIGERRHEDQSPVGG